MSMMLDPGPGTYDWWHVLDKKKIAEKIPDQELEDLIGYRPTPGQKRKIVKLVLAAIGPESR